jgi:hypothetical protein
MIHIAMILKTFYISISTKKKKKNGSSDAFQ